MLFKVAIEFKAKSFRFAFYVSSRLYLVFVHLIIRLPSSSK